MISSKSGNRPEDLSQSLVPLPTDLLIKNAESWVMAPELLNVALWLKGLGICTISFPTTRH